MIKLKKNKTLFVQVSKTHNLKKQLMKLFCMLMIFSNFFAI